MAFSFHFALNLEVKSQDHKTIRVFTSHGYLPSALIDKFEHQTGIKILVDVFDNDDGLEGNLLAGASSIETGATGYDVVFPSAWPYLMRQITYGFYQPLDHQKIANFAKIDPFFVDSLKGPEQGNLYAVPFIWGLSGFAFNAEEIHKRLPNTPLDSWATFFNADVLEKLSTCGISLLDEPADLLISAQLSLGIEPGSEKTEDLAAVTQLYQKIRRHIRRFDSARSNDEIVQGDLCLVQHWLGAMVAASAHLGTHTPQASLKYVIPKEGCVMWIDTMAIPKSAPNLEGAYLFINFLLEPENIALITNETYFANTVKSSRPYIREDIRNNPILFPDSSVFDRVVKHHNASSAFQKQLTRAFTKIRSGQ